MLTLACASPKFPPQKRRVPARPTYWDLKKAIHHAENLCYNYEDTPECRAAWERAEELSIELLGSNKNRKGEKERLSEGEPEQDRSVLSRRAVARFDDELMDVGQRDI